MDEARPLRSSLLEPGWSHRCESGVGEGLDLVEVGFGDQCVGIFGAYQFPTFTRSSSWGTLARCSVINSPVETFQPLGFSRRRLKTATGRPLHSPILTVALQCLPLSLSLGEPLPSTTRLGSFSCFTRGGFRPPHPFVQGSPHLAHSRIVPSAKAASWEVVVVNRQGMLRRGTCTVLRRSGCSLQFSTC